MIYAIIGMAAFALMAVVSIVMFLLGLPIVSDRLSKSEYEDEVE